MSITVQNYAQVGEASAAMARDRDAVFLGGGTLLMRDINEGRAAFSTVIRTTDAAFRTMRATGAGLELGAGMTMSDVLASRELDFLHAAARAVGGPAIRNMASVGGNLFARSPYGDFTAALLALEARVTFAGGRELPLDEMLRTRESATDGVVSHVTVPRPPGGAEFRFVKVSRVKPKGVAVLSIAALLPMSAGRIQDARIAYGAMAPTPIRVTAVEQALEGRTLDAQGISAALAAATQGTSPATDAIASEWYRREVAPVHLRRLLLGETAGSRR